VSSEKLCTATALRGFDAAWQTADSRHILQRLRYRSWAQVAMSPFSFALRALRSAVYSATSSQPPVPDSNCVGCNERWTLGSERLMPVLVS
jgi:hypothetical protein